MATDGPKPRVPPPPKLTQPGSVAVSDQGGRTAPASADDDAWLALIEDDPTSPKETAIPSAAEADAPVAPVEEEPTAPKAVEADEDAKTLAASLETKRALVPELEAEIELPEVAEPPPPPPARRGVLPPPKSDGKRVQPLSSKGLRRGAPKAPTAAGLPSGLVPPGAPEERERADTDVLIASAVAALTEGAPAPAEATAEAPVPLLDADDPPPLVTPSPPPEPVVASTDPPSNPRVLWIGLAGVAAALLLLILFARNRDEDPSPTTVAAQGDAEPPEDTLERSAVAAQPAPPPEPAAEHEPAALPVEVPPDLGGDVVALADAPDVGTDLALALDVGSPEDEVPAEAVAEAEPSSSSTNRGRKGRHKSKGRPAADRSRPPPTKPAAADEPDAKALLAEARKALASGQARRAYSLAAKSKKAKRSSAALVVMAKAACRFGGEPQAKAAFKQLSVSDRRGIRSECRNNGIRLGL